MRAIWKQGIRIGGWCVRSVQNRGKWVAGVVGLPLALAVFYVAPLILVPDSGLDPQNRLKAEHDLRTTFVQAVGGAIVLLGTWRTIHINREGQITERFSRAIEHLGHTDDKLDIRLGGIYALERIARDSKSDQGPIVEVLTAFLREHAGSESDLPCPSCNRSAPEPASRRAEPAQVRADFQAVATVLGRNRWSTDRPFALGHVDLCGAKLAGAHLEEADLHSAHFERADLGGAHLEGADLGGAHLEGAFLGGAYLERANLRAAHLGPGPGLFGATLLAAHLEGAILADADLAGTLLAGANLEGAFLAGANLQGAVLTEARLKGATFFSTDLRGIDLDADQREGIIVLDVDRYAGDGTDPEHGKLDVGDSTELRRYAEETPPPSELSSEPPDDECH